MKHPKTRLAVIAIGLLTMVAVTLADYNTLNKTTYYQNATNGARVNSTGDARVEVTNPEFRQTLYVPTFLDCQLEARPIDAGKVDSMSASVPTLPSVVRDSTQPYPVSGYNNLALMIHPTFSARHLAVRVAIQVRWHPYAVSDTQSTFVEMDNIATAPSPTVRDTIGSNVHMGRYLGYIGAAATFSERLASADEQVVVLTNTGTTTRGVLIRLGSPNREYSAAGPYVSVRVRYLSATCLADGTNHVANDSRAGEVGLPLRLKAALVGWR